MRVRIKNSYYKSFIQDNLYLIFSTSSLCLNLAKIPILSFSAFSSFNILKIKNLLFFLNKAIVGSKEEFIIYIISKVKIKYLYLRELYNKEIIDLKGKEKARGKKSYLVLSSY